MTRRLRGRATGVNAALRRWSSPCVVPILLLLVFGIIQYGLYFWSMQAGTSAVGEAVRRMTVGDCQTACEMQTLMENRLGSASTTTAPSDDHREHATPRRTAPPRWPLRARSAAR